MVIFSFKQGSYGESSASITAFLTILFLLFFSMAGVMFESARVLSSDGYLRVAARSAAMTVFGDYTRELFEEYGLFSYGGYDGIGALELNQEFLSVLQKNLKAAPEGKEMFYADLYRFQEVDSEVMLTNVLTEKEIFHEQIRSFLKRQAVQDITGEIKQKISGNAQETATKDKLALTKDYEEGKYEQEEETGSTTAETEEKENQKEDDSRTKNEKRKQETEEELKKDAAGGNPLTAFSELAGSGILYLVCDENQVEKGTIIPREKTGDLYGEETSSGAAAGETGEKGAADYLQDILGEEDNQLYSTTKEKTELLLYSLKQFADYTHPLEKRGRYGLEYLVAGKEEEKQNLSYVVNRLLALRLILNLGYIVSDPVLQEKSLATATVLAGFTGLPPVISAVQYTILMILSFQEACIDVTALLEGRQVPVIKNAANFQMRYEEICIGTKGLFQKKAAALPKEKKAGQNAIDYQQYLIFLLLLKEEKTIRSRSLDLIQFDLRERFNQTFSVDHCICKSTWEVDYRTPYLFDHLPFLSWQEETEKLHVRSQEVAYGYRSK